MRRQVLREAARRGEPAVVLEQLSHALSQDALTIGFARRVATYKRASLFLQDPDRLASLVNDPQRPIQFVIAGKAHPRDEPAKGVLRQIHELSRDSRFIGKLVFLEDYDISLGRQLVQGVDVWLNNPRRPQEASGTSGQKVLLNGGLNLSVLDGWWAEAYDGTNGFAIGMGETHTSPEAHDRRDADELLQVLSEEVSPALLRSRPGRCAARLDGADEAGHPHPRLAVQRRPDGDGLRAALLPARRGRPVERHAAAVSPDAGQGRRPARRTSTSVTCGSAFRTSNP